MNTRLPTLIEVLYPPSFASHPLRVRVTRTVVQPDFDAFEEAELESARKEWTAHVAARTVAKQARLAGGAP
jgi:hypothetical protein